MLVQRSTFKNWFAWLFTNLYEYRAWCVQRNLSTMWSQHKDKCRIAGRPSIGHPKAFFKCSCPHEKNCPSTFQLFCFSRSLCCCLCNRIYLIMHHLPIQILRPDWGSFRSCLAPPSLQNIENSWSYRQKTRFRPFRIYWYPIAQLKESFSLGTVAIERTRLTQHAPKIIGIFLSPNINGASKANFFFFG